MDEEAVLKTVGCKSFGGSNPSSSARRQLIKNGKDLTMDNSLTSREFLEGVRSNVLISKKTYNGELAEWTNAAYC